MLQDPMGLFQTLNIETASWYQAIPTDVKGYMSSVGSEAARLATANAAPAPTGGVHAAVAGVVGVVAGAAIFL
jgi:hypothetical protein